MKVSELLEDRMSRLRNSWALLPAAKVLFNKSKVSMDDVMKQWDSGSILVTENKGKTVFLFSSGEWGKGDVGKSHQGHHDQTFRDFGMFHVVNVVHYKNGEIKDKVNDKGLSEKAPLMVFK